MFIPNYPCIIGDKSKIGIVIINETQNKFLDSLTIFE